MAWRQAVATSLTCMKSLGWFESPCSDVLLFMACMSWGMNPLPGRGWSP